MFMYPHFILFLSKMILKQKVKLFECLIQKILGSKINFFLNSNEMPHFLGVFPPPPHRGSMATPGVFRVSLNSLSSGWN